MSLLRSAKNQEIDSIFYWPVCVEIDTVCVAGKSGQLLSRVIQENPSNHKGIYPLT